MVSPPFRPPPCPLKMSFLGCSSPPSQHLFDLAHQKILSFVVKSNPVQVFFITAQDLSSATTRKKGKVATGNSINIASLFSKRPTTSVVSLVEPISCHLLTSFCCVSDFSCADTANASNYSATLLSKKHSQVMKTSATIVVARVGIIKTFLDFIPRPMSPVDCFLQPSFEDRVNANLFPLSALPPSPDHHLVVDDTHQTTMVLGRFLIASALMYSSDGAENMPKELVEKEEEGIFSQQQKEYPRQIDDDLRQMDDDESVKGDRRSKDKNVASASFKEAEEWKIVSAQKSPEVSSSPRGLDHSITVPARTERNKFLADREIMLYRSMTENRGSPRQDLLLDRLSEREKQKLIANLVKIQNDGTVEVDLGKSTPVASELLELQSFGELTTSGSFVSESKKIVPRLQIVILVVGTRGDVQPFLAIAKRLQAC
ncbi:sterol 3-beta-glucosyltransferase UGT80B1-like [Senna tora]|uniref:Sterol 3-beta-glucosyltransferase UGT80B1-like n=1 Tax=Senna tora TaxID=362788 RepID=A0A834T1W4_9FABA|nr:sterol 3-beta-glucosyltransferase UGT80B1-like [Senna tora]